LLKRVGVPIFFAKSRQHGAKTVRNTAVLPEVTPGVVALAAAAVAITGPFSDAGRALNLRAQRGQGIGGVTVQAGSQCRCGPVESPMLPERNDAASTGCAPATLARSDAQTGRVKVTLSGCRASAKFGAAWTKGLEHVAFGCGNIEPVLYILVDENGPGAARIYEPAAARTW
jgi:hypothetical protein